MRKTAVVYQSAYGATEAYAREIARAVSADLFQLKDATPSRLEDYDTLLFGGGIYAGTIQGARLMEKRFAQLPGKLLAVFSVGFTPADRADILTKVAEKSFSESTRKRIRFFHLPAGIDYPHLRPLHRLMLAFPHFILAHKPEQALTEANKKALAAYGKPRQPLPLEQIQPLVEYVRSASVAPTPQAD